MCKIEEIENLFQLMLVTSAGMTLHWSIVLFNKNRNKLKILPPVVKT